MSEDKFLDFMILQTEKERTNARERLSVVCGIPDSWVIFDNKNNKELARGVGGFNACAVLLRYWESLLSIKH